MNKKLSQILLSTTTLVLASGLMVGATYALFSDTVHVNNHLEAGTLSVGLKRVSYQERMLSTDGTMEDSVVDSSKVDLKTDGAKLFNFVKAVPTSWQKATIEVSNLGDVAFDFGVRLLFNESSNATAQQIEFAKQIQITVTKGAELTKTFVLNDAANNDVALGSVLANGAAQNFDIKAEFKDDVKNNEVQSITLDFDMQVYATQKTN